MTRVVPRSGCLRMRNAGKATAESVKNISLKPAICLLAKSEAMTIASTSFAGSEG